MLRKLLAVVAILAVTPSLPAAPTQAAPAPAQAAQTTSSSTFQAATVSTGDAHSCALDASDSVWCWGANTNGQLGDGTKTARLVPTRVPSLSGVSSVQAAAKFSCALKTDGTVWCWGFNSIGQLADGTKIDKLVPTRVPSLSSITAIAGGASPLSPMCALKSDATAWCWGPNTLGQLGDGTKLARLAPVKVRFAGGISIIAPGPTSCLVSSGNPYCWGQNNLGQIGDGTKSARLTPTAVPRLGQITRIATSPSTTCAIDADARTWCWGGNAQGRVGDGTTTDRLSPVRVLDLDAASQIDTADATCALTTQGAPRCWGLNSAGAVGDGTKLNRRTSTGLSRSINATSIATSAHSCAAASDGTVWCWGQGAAGQLGNAQKLSALTPQQASPTATPATTTTTTTTTTTIPRTTTTTPGTTTTTTTTIPRTTTTTTTIPRTTTTTTTTTVPAPSQPAAPTLGMNPPTAAGSVSVASVSFPLIAGATSYRTECRTGSQRVPAAGTVSPIIVPRLTAGASYACTLSVLVRGVWSAPSELSNSAVAYRTPMPPTDVQAAVVPASPGSVSVSFAPALENGSPISSYRATCTSVVGSTARRYAQGTSSPLTVTDLPPGKPYVCTTAAQNQAGWSMESVSSTAFSTYAPPAAPANLSAVASDRAATLSWDPVASTQTAPVGGYRVYRADALVCQVIAPTTSCAATGLQNGTEYAFQVLAYYQGTEGALSDPATATPFGRPATPVIDSVDLEPSSSSATLEASTASAEGAPLTDWEAVCSNLAAAVSLSATTLAASIPLTGLSFGETYSCTVRTRNAAGWSEPSDPVAVTPYDTPAAPGELTAAVADGSLELSWVEPAANGRPVTAYTVEYSSDAATWSDPQTTTATALTLTGLANGTSYTVRVRAQNLAGASAPAIVTATPVARPLPPASVTASPSDATVTLSWSQPDAATAGVTSWRVSANGATLCETTTSSCAATGLTNGTEYSFTVRAVGPTGTSDPSDPVSAVPFASPDAPTVTLGLEPPSAHAVTRLAATVAPTATNGRPVTAAELSCTAETASGPQTITASDTDAADGFAFAVQTAHAAVDHTCKARVENLAGWSVWSPVSATVVPYRTADAPSIAVSLVNETPTSVLAVVTPAAFDGGRAVTAYRVECSSLTGETRTQTGQTASLTVAGLTPAATYTCRAQVENLAGWSVWSEDSERIYPRTVPAAPALLEVDANPDGSLTVRWDAPSFDGGAPIAAYVVTASPTGQTCRTTTTSCTFTGLDLGRQYVFVVVAENIAGTSPGTSPVTAVPVSVPAAPDAPVPVVNPTTPTTVELFYTPASSNTPVTAYSATCTSLTGETRGAVGTDTPLVVEDLTPGATYTCTLAARNATGWSGDSAPSAAFVPFNVPGTPSTLTAAPDDTLVVLSWVPLTSTAASPVAGYRVYVNGTATSLGCTASGADASSCTVTGLQNGFGYTFQIAAYYAQSEGPLSAPVLAVPRTTPDTPGTPTIALSTTTPGAIDVTFAEPASSGGATASYVATCRSADGGTTVLATGTLIPLTVTGATASKTYACTVLARNAAGDSPETDPSNSLTVVGAPRLNGNNAATGVAVTAVAVPDSHTATATVAPGGSGWDDQGSPITAYAVSCESSDGGPSVPEIVDSVPYFSLTGFQPGRTYTCRYSATNASGTSSYTSEPFLAVAGPASPTGLAVTVPALTPTVPTLTWVPPANTGGSPLTAYTVTCSSSNGGTARTITTGVQVATPLTGLTAGATYRCQVRAANSLTSGELSAASADFVPYNTPGTPTGLAATPGSGQVTLSWNPLSSSSASPVAGYRVYVGGTLGCQVVGSAVGGCTVTGLQNGTPYSFQVSAYYDQSEGALSAAVSSTPRSTPGAPTLVTASPSTSAVSLAFTAPASNGGAPITSYYAECYSTNGGGTYGASGGSPVSVSLAAGYGYVCRVKAYNDAGWSDWSNTRTLTAVRVEQTTYVCNGSDPGGGVNNSGCAGYVSTVFDATAYCATPYYTGTSWSTFVSGRSYPHQTNYTYDGLGCNTGYWIHRRSSGGTCWSTTSGAINNGNNKGTCSQSGTYKYVYADVFSNGGFAFNCYGYAYAPYSMAKCQPNYPNDGYWFSYTATSSYDSSYWNGWSVT